MKENFQLSETENPGVFTFICGNIRLGNFNTKVQAFTQLLGLFIQKKVSAVNMENLAQDISHRENLHVITEKEKELIQIISIHVGRIFGWSVDSLDKNRALLKAARAILKKYTVVKRVRTK